MAQPNRRNLYRDNGAAAYDVYAWNDQTARQYDDNRAYERTLPIELPDDDQKKKMMFMDESIGQIEHLIKDLVDWAAI